MYTYTIKQEDLPYVLFIFHRDGIKYNIDYTAYYKLPSITLKCNLNEKEYEVVKKDIRCEKQRQAMYFQALDRQEDGSMLNEEEKAKIAAEIPPVYSFETAVKYEDQEKLKRLQQLNKTDSYITLDEDYEKFQHFYDYV